MDSPQVVWSWVSAAIFPPFIFFYLPFSFNLLLSHQLLLYPSIRGPDSKATDVNGNLSMTSKSFVPNPKWLILSIYIIYCFLSAGWSNFLNKKKSDIYWNNRLSDEET